MPAWFPENFVSSGAIGRALVYSEPREISKMELFAEIVKIDNCFGRKLHFRCLTGFWVKASQ